MSPASPPAPIKPDPIALGLAALVGDDHVLTAAEDIIPYGFDGTAALRQTPRVVVFPASTAETAAVVHFAHAHELPVHPRGAGTGLSGGSVPVAGGLVICLNRLQRIHEVDTRNLTLRVEAGVATHAVADAAARHGLFYPPDPSSLRVCTIGGNIAENSGGLRGLKYGVTRDYVLGLTVVLPDGAVATLGNACVKDVAGYALKDLFIGSEGTLGIVTEVLLRLVPPPAARRTLLATFDRMEDAAETVSAIIAEHIIPCTLEFLDQTTIRCVEDYAHVGLPTDCSALLLMETDGHLAAVAEEAAAMARIATAHGARDVRTARDSAEAADLARARRTAFSALARLRPTTLLEDFTVPRSELAALVAFIAAAAARHQVQVGTFGHMGDGNLHPTFLTDERDAEEMRRVHLALDEIVTRTLELGGTITGEHGVGLAKKPWLKQQLGETAFDLLRRVKHAIDPAGRMNPGKIFD